MGRINIFSLHAPRRLLLQKLASLSKKEDVDEKENKKYVYIGEREGGRECLDGSLRLFRQFMFTFYRVLLCHNNDGTFGHAVSMCSL